jgi:hypothetical protein
MAVVFRNERLSNFTTEIDIAHLAIIISDYKKKSEFREKEDEDFKKNWNLKDLNCCLLPSRHR